MLTNCVESAKTTVPNDVV